MNELIVYGQCPNSEQIAALYKWFQEHLKESVIATRDCEKYFVGEPLLENIPGGLLAVRIGHSRTDIIVWFRGSISEQVNWAGSIEKPLTQTSGGYRLLPRESFALWKETVKSRSLSWETIDLDIANRITQILLEGKAIFSENANRAKSDFLAKVSHEMRTPMNAIIGVASLLQRGKDIDASERQLIEILKVSSSSLLHLINDLLGFSKN